MIDPALIQRQIALLDPHRFVELMSDLLSELASANNIPRGCLATNLRLAAPDGGVDARCIDSPALVGRFIPATNTAYQFKAGVLGSAALVARDEVLAKPRVMDALKSGQTFVLASSHDSGDGFEDLVRRAVLESLPEANRPHVAPDQIVYIGGHSIAKALTDFPALLFALVGAGNADLMTLPQALRTRSLAHPFQPDDALTSQSAEALNRVSASPRLLRVIGAAGQGKTRFVLETLASSPLAHSVLYAPQPQALSPEFKAFLLRTPSARCTVVVDEVPRNDARALEDYWQVMPPAVRLVTIGLGTGVANRPTTISLQPVADDTLVRIIQSVTPGIADNTAGQMARLCRGSPKLAVLLAERVHDDPSLVAAHHLVRDQGIQDGLAHYLPFETTSLDWRALALVAVTGHIGWLDDLEDEASSLYRAVGLDPDLARRHVDALHERFGIAPLAGRYRYVSPEILAVFIAAREVSTWTSSRIETVIGALGERASWRFGLRLRTILGAIPNRHTIERTLFNDSTTASLGALVASGRSNLIARLAPAFPRSSLVALESLIDNATVAELEDAVGVRHDLVSALEALIWRADTFVRAANLLLRLAIAENQPRISNNASGLFAETFQTRLGRTAAGAVPRMRVLRLAAAHKDPRARKLAAKAIGKVVALGHVSRVGGPPDDLEDQPQESWQPATFGEWWQFGAEALRLLPPLLTDPEEDVRTAAADALCEGIALAFAKYAHEAWLEVAGPLVDGPQPIRSKLARALRLELRRTFTRGDIGPEALSLLGPIVEPDPVQEIAGDDDVSTEQDEPPTVEATKELEERARTLAHMALALSGSDFSSRLRMAIDLDVLAYGTTDYSTLIARTRQALEALATEGLAVPDVITQEWPWFAAGHHQHAFLWADVLGRADAARVVAAGLEDYARRNPSCAPMHSLYELGQQTARGEGWVDVRAAVLVRDGAAELAFDLLVRAGYTPRRTQELARLLASGLLPPRAVSMLITFTPRSGMPADDVLTLIAACVGRGADPAEVVDFVWMCLNGDATLSASLRDSVLALLESFSTAGEHSREVGVMEKHAFYELAKFYAQDAPKEVMRAVLTLEMSRFGAHGDQDARSVLRLAWGAGDRLALLDDVITPALSVRGIGAWRLMDTLEHFPIAEVGLERLTAWIGENPEERAEVVAKMVGNPLPTRASDVHTMLLERFAEHGVGTAFYGSLISGVFWGSGAERTRGIIESLKPLATHPNPAMREWTEATLADLGAMLQHDERREAEDDLR